MSVNRSLMVVHAHPDDEVFSTGGILAKYAAEGARVVVVYATRGEAGEMHDANLDPADAIPRLGEIREQEVRTACAVLGVSDLRFLGYQDSGMVDTDANKNPANFMNAPLDEAVDRLLTIMRETQPQVLVTYDEDGGYGHPDHVMCNRVTREAFKRTQGESWAPKKLYFSARARESFGRYIDELAKLDMKIPWMNDDFKLEEFGVPEAEISTHVGVGQYAVLKKRALMVHRTQISDDFFYFQIPDEVFPDAMGTEHFQRILPPLEPDEHETDLFDGIHAGVAERETSASVSV